MSFLLDTNVVSETFRGRNCNVRVAQWLEATEDRDLFISVLVVGELRKGAERLRSRDLHRAQKTEAWVAVLQEQYALRILPITSAVAEEWGRMSATRDLPVVDSLMAATARVHGLTVVTRNTADFDGLGVSLLNPFEA